MPLLKILLIASAACVILIRVSLYACTIPFQSAPPDVD